MSSDGNERVLMISSDCHAGTLPSGYNEFMPKAYHEEANAWWVQYTREMMNRVGTFFDQELQYLQVLIVRVEQRQVQPQPIV